jgi:hypothetical protein
MIINPIAKYDSGKANYRNKTSRFHVYSVVLGLSGQVRANLARFDLCADHLNLFQFGTEE